MTGVPEARISIVTVFCRRDLWHSALQARSLRLFLAPRAVAEVLFIYNEYDHHLTSAELGRLKNEFGDVPVSFAHCLDFAPSFAGVSPLGWSSQQILKILAACSPGFDNWPPRCLEWVVTTQSGLPQVFLCSVGRRFSVPA